MDDLYKSPRGLHEVVILGDYLDVYGCSFHEKHFDVKWDFHEEIHAGIERLKELRSKYPKSKITYLEGNHEFRLTRWMWRNAKELFGFIDLPTLLTLDDLDIQWVPYHRSQQYRIANTSLHARHEPLKGGVHCAYGSSLSGDIIFGHTHRYQRVTTVGKLDHIERVGISAGWLGNEEEPCFNYVGTKMDWTHSFTIITVDSEGRWFDEPVNIKDGRAYYNGIFYGV
jgi:hypothetical protein